jgi:hypothetical protein
VQTRRNHAWKSNEMPNAEFKSSKGLNEIFNANELAKIPT